MQYIATLIASPDISKLDEHVINRVIIAMEKKGANIENIQFLAADVAIDIFYYDLEFDIAKEILANICSELKLDFAIQKSDALRHKQLLISDMDSTMIEQECIDEIADKLNLKDKVASITEDAMNGKIDFTASLKKRVALLEGLDADLLQKVYDNNISFSKGAKKLVQTMKQNGATTILVSGGFTFFTTQVAKHLGFDQQYANNLEIKDNCLTGKVLEPILDSSSKLDYLNSESKKLNIETYNTIAVGDGANDLPMLKNAGIGVAYKAKDSVKKQAHMQINYTDLTSLLYIQGYKFEDIIDG